MDFQRKACGSMRLSLPYSRCHHKPIQVLSLPTAQWSSQARSTQGRGATSAPSAEPPSPPTPTSAESAGAAEPAMSARLQHRPLFTRRVSQSGILFCIIVSRGLTLGTVRASSRGRVYPVAPRGLILPSNHHSFSNPNPNPTAPCLATKVRRRASRSHKGNLLRAAPHRPRPWDHPA